MKCCRKGGLFVCFGVLVMVMVSSVGLGAGTPHPRGMSGASTVSGSGRYWAILICGSDDYNAGFENDIRDVYLMLTQNLSYDPNYIYYVAPHNWNGAVHYYTNTKANIQAVFQTVANLANQTDNVFVDFGGHGTHDPWTIEPNVSPSDLDGWLDLIDPCWLYGLPRHCQQMVVVLQSCYCGGFISTITTHEAYPSGAAHRQRLVITSADAQTKSWEDMNGYGDPNWDPNGLNDDGSSWNGNSDGSEFSAGLREGYRDIDGNTFLEADDNPYLYKSAYPPDVSAPYGNHDGRVSVKESFLFGKFEDCYSTYWQTYCQQSGAVLEYPQFWDARTWGDPQGIDPAATYIYTRAPMKPSTPSGPAQGSINTEYTYSSSAVDPDGDQVYLLFDWGDGSNSSWNGPYASGTSVSAKHTWTVKGDYQVKVKAKEAHGVEGPWSNPLPISMPVPSGLPQDGLLASFLARHPHLFPMLRHLLHL